MQYMSASKGVYHSEHNFGEDILRFLNVWIYPDKDGYTPNYCDNMIEWSDRKEKGKLTKTYVK